LPLLVDWDTITAPPSWEHWTKKVGRPRSINGDKIPLGSIDNKGFTPRYPMGQHKLTLTRIATPLAVDVRN
jgi:hypothetical protein